MVFFSSFYFRTPYIIWQQAFLFFYSVGRIDKDFPKNNKRFFLTLWAVRQHAFILKLFAPHSSILGRMDKKLIVATTINLHSIKRIKRINAFTRQTYNFINPWSAVAFQLDFGTKRIPFSDLGTLFVSLGVCVPSSSLS